MRYAYRVEYGNLKIIDAHDLQLQSGAYFCMECFHTANTFLNNDGQVNHFRHKQGNEQCSLSKIEDRPPKVDPFDSADIALIEYSNEESDSKAAEWDFIWEPNTTIIKPYLYNLRYINIFYAVYDSINHLHYWKRINKHISSIELTSSKLLFVLPRGNFFASNIRDILALNPFQKLKLVKKYQFNYDLYEFDLLQRSDLNSISSMVRELTGNKHFSLMNSSCYCQFLSIPQYEQNAVTFFNQPELILEYSTDSFHLEVIEIGNHTINHTLSFKPYTSGYFKLALKQKTSPSAHRLTIIFYSIINGERFNSYNNTLEFNYTDKPLPIKFEYSSPYFISINHQSYTTGGTYPMPEKILSAADILINLNHKDKYIYDKWIINIDGYIHQGLDTNELTILLMNNINAYYKTDESETHTQINFIEILHYQLGKIRFETVNSFNKSTHWQNMLTYALSTSNPLLVVNPNYPLSANIYSRYFNGIK